MHNPAGAWRPVRGRQRAGRGDARPWRLSVCAWVMQVSTALKRQRVAAMATPIAGIARVDVSQLWTPPGFAASGGKPKSAGKRQKKRASGGPDARNRGETKGLLQDRGCAGRVRGMHPRCISRAGCRPPGFRCTRTARACRRRRRCPTCDGRHGNPASLRSSRD